MVCRVWLGWVLAGLLICAASLRAQTAGDEIRIIELQGTVEIMPAGATTWVLTQTNQLLHPGDKLRTGANSRLALKWSDQSVVPFGALTEMQILPPDQAGSLPGLNLVKGILSFFHRDNPGRIKIITHGATASVEGTEFVLRADDDHSGGRVTLAVVDGKVQFSNPQGSVLLTNDEEAVVIPGQPPARTAGFIANNLLQWCFYYPGVLNLDDLNFSADERAALKNSLDYYRAGDLLGALKNYPASRSPGSDSVKIYHAALLLSVGQVEQTETELNSLADGKLAESLRMLIAAVKRQPRPSTLDSRLSTELLAASYYEQSRATGEDSLKSALELARRAANVAPQFGFAWARVAELEFGFGRTREAEMALDKSLTLSPRNAEALALKGFLLAAQNHIGEAKTWFDRAIATDAALGNAWLGRGLCRIRRGDTAGGRSDLLVAAALEPQRAVLRSYLGKAFSDAGKMDLANKELGLARRLDPGDPTRWLYSALTKQQENRVNEAIAELEKSGELNDNRSVYRSQMLLDQDAAVSSANLASIYRDAGMTDVSVREAAKAVTDDEANSSAHLFLADSYFDLRDPTQFNLRYETVWFNELLLANLLAPIGGGRLAQNVSQQEYSKLFTADGFGFANSTLLRSDNSLSQLTSQYGTLGNSSYAFDLDYEHNNGVRPNNDLDSIQWDTTIKQQVTPQDTLLGLVQYQDYHSGDNFQYYNQNSARRNYRFDESQEPMLLAGWHHEWAPGVHTLFLGGRLENEQHFSDLATPQLALIQDATGKTVGAATLPLNVEYRNKLEVFTAELKQIVQWNRVTIDAGARYQAGDFTASSLMNTPPVSTAFLFNAPAAAESDTDGFERLTGYGYLTIEPVRQLWLTGGLAYDDLTYPRNFRSPPLVSGTDHASQLGPKAAVVWNPFSAITLRGTYTKSLGGVSLDESYRLEPTQLAGFPQAFRSLIPESVVGSVAAPEYQTYGLALDLKFPTGTYAGVQVQRLETSVRLDVGLFSLNNGIPPLQSASTPEALDYRENDISASINQLVGKHFVLGTGYSFSQVRLDDNLTGVPVSALPTARQQLNSDLHQVGGYILFNHPSGFFARVETHWYLQSNSGYNPALPGDNFFQENIFAGWRFAHRHAQITAGILDLFDSAYHLNPLTIHEEWPHQRTFTLQLDFIY